MKKTIMKLAACILSAAMIISLTACVGSTETAVVTETEVKEEAAFEIQPLVGEPWDYSDKNNWMFFDNNDDVDHDVDVFFLYPTSVSSTVQEVVCDNIDGMRQNAYKNYLMAADTLSSFTNMYVPYYRQISAVGIGQVSKEDEFVEMVKSNVTRTDVYAALDYYFEKCNNGKPYILAAHSQGSCNLKIVLSEYMKLHPEYMDNLIACYAIGWYFPDSWFEENPQIKPATGETDTGVLITWNTEGPGATKPNILLGNNDGFNINPLNWKTDETPADVSLNKGSTFADMDIAADVYGFISENKAAAEAKDIEIDISKGVDVTRKLIMTDTEGVADAIIDLDRGALVTTTYDGYLPDSATFGDKSCHFEDWSLFTINIRENAQKRIAAFLGHEGK